MSYNFHLQCYTNRYFVLQMLSKTQTEQLLKNTVLSRIYYIKNGNVNHPHRCLVKSINSGRYSCLEILGNLTTGSRSILLLLYQSGYPIISRYPTISQRVIIHSDLRSQYYCALQLSMSNFFNFSHLTMSNYEFNKYTENSLSFINLIQSMTYFIHKTAPSRYLTTATI